MILYCQSFSVYNFRLSYPIVVKILKTCVVLVVVDVSVFIEKDTLINSSKTQLYLQTTKYNKHSLNVCRMIGK